MLLRTFENIFLHLFVESLVKPSQTQELPPAAPSKLSLSPLVYVILLIMLIVEMITWNAMSIAVFTLQN